MSRAAWSAPSGLGVTALLALATVASRVPFMSEMLYSYDAANYAFAVRDYFHVGHHQPHPPGYPLYVGSAWLLDRVLRDPNRSLVAVGIVASAVAVAATHRLAVAQHGGAVGLAAGLLLLVSPGFWGYGEVAYPYTALAGFGAMIALVANRLRDGSDRLAAASGALVGVAAGFRWDLLIELTPLWALGLLRCSRRGWLLAAVTCLAVGLAWAWPMVRLSGGLDEYLAALRAQSGYIVGAYSVAGGGETIARYNADLILQYVRLIVGAPLLLLVYTLGRTLAPARVAADERLRFLLVWLVPPLVVFLLLHIGDPGYLLVLLPAVCILAAVGLSDLAADLRQVARMLALRTSKAFGLRLRQVAEVAPAALLAGLLVWSANTFLRAPGPTRLPEIRHIDRLLATQTSYLTGQVARDSAIVLAHDRFRQMQYYLPGYRVVLLFDEYEPNYESRVRTIDLPEGTRQVALLDSAPALGPRAAAASTSIPLYDGPGGTIRLLDVGGATGLEYGYGRVELLPAM
jgi:4-amino-4-deoxy-L-arabinose transferase-like glycosyltransferase